MQLDARERSICLPDPVPPTKPPNMWPLDFPWKGYELHATVYTVRELWGADWSFRFLAPIDWSVERAIEHQFGK